MVTALTIFGSAKPATTLTGAGQLFTASGGTVGSTSTKVGTTAQFVQIFALGSTAGAAGVASIPAPTDANFAGWMLDATTLEAQRLASGTWTMTFNALASNGGTITATMQFFKRSSAGVYTSIGATTGSSVTLTTTSANILITTPSFSLMDFAVGDKLVMWLWFNITVAGTSATGTMSIREVGSAATLGVVSCQAVTPGFSPSPVALAGTMDGVGTLAGTLSANTALSGEFDGVGTCAATLSATTALSSQLSGVGTLAGTIQLSTALATTLAGVGQLSGTLALTTALSTTCAGAGTLSGTLSARTALSSTLAGAGTLVGTLTLSTALAATCTGAGTLSGVFSLRVALSCAFMGVGTLAGTLSIPGAARYLTATWVTRDMQATWVTRDDLGAWKGRDAQAAWASRDEKDTWNTRDEQESWTTRG